MSKCDSGLKQLHLNRLGCEDLYEDTEVLSQVQYILAATCSRVKHAEWHTSCAQLQCPVAERLNMNTILTLVSVLSLSLC